VIEIGAGLLPTPQIGVLQRHPPALGLLFLVAGRHHSTS
jgi:hypothetical protein